MKLITLLTWPDYISPSTLAGFTEEFDVEVSLEIVPSAVELVERMQAWDPVIDVLVPPDYAVRDLNASGRLATLDHSLLPNLVHIDPRFRSGRAHDPGSQVSIVKDWGTTGFMFRTDRVWESPATWADFWSLAETYSGKVTVLDSPGEVIGAALKKRGHSYNASDTQALSGAREDLLALKLHLLAFETNYKPLLRQDEAWLSLGWNGDAVALAAEGLPIRYVVPGEGSQIWEDDWALAAHAPHPQEAHLFLNYILEPQVAAQEARYTRYATGNRGALALLDEAMRNDLSTYPPEAVLARLEAGLPMDEAGTKRRAALWSEVRG